MKGSKFHRRAVVPAGSPPGTLISTGGMPEPVLHLISYDADSLEETSIGDVDALRDVVQRDGVSWLDVHGLGDEGVIRALGDVFQIHPLALADVVNLGQRPKAEGYGEQLFVVVRMVTVDDGLQLHWQQVSIVLGPRYVLTFQETPADCFDPIRTRLRLDRKLIRGSGADYLATMIIDAVVDEYFPVMEAFGERLEDVEERVLRDPGRAVLMEVYRAKRELLKFRRAAWPLRDTLSQLLRDPPATFQATTLPYLRDTADHVMQIVDIVESYRELAGSFVDVYLSSVGNRTNEVMRVLTVLASIFIPLTFLAGIYGMNFDTEAPLNLPELGWQYGYIAFLTVCLVVAVSLLWMFWRLGWLRGVGTPPADEDAAG